MQFKYRHAKNSTLALLACALGAAALIWVWMLSEVPAGGEDSWNHYLFARWGLKHPEKLLDQWAKPLFTTIVLIPAQFGYKSVIAVNLIVTLICAWFCYLTARRLNFKQPWLASILFIFQPVVFGNSISMLTEPLTALFLIICIYLIVVNKFSSAAILAGCLPLLRTEGFIILAFIIFYFIFKRKWKHLPWLFCGTIFLTIFGALVSKDWLYIIHNNPYFSEKSPAGNWGHGDWFYYINKHKEIWGQTIFILTIIATVLLLFHTVYLIQRKTPQEKSKIMYWLIWPAFFAFFCAHTILWKYGLMGSNGLTRVFLAVAPLVVLLCMYVIDRILSFDILSLNYAIIACIFITVFHGAYSGNYWRMPWHKETTMKGSPTLPQIKIALNYIKENKIAYSKIIHQLPTVDVLLDTDPYEEFNKAKTAYIWSIHPDPSIDFMPVNAIVLWDGYHATREGGKPLYKMRSYNAYQEIKYFKGKDSIFDVRLFKKIR